MGQRMRNKYVLSDFCFIMPTMPPAFLDERKTNFKLLIARWVKVSAKSLGCKTSSYPNCVATCLKTTGVFL